MIPDSQGPVSEPLTGLRGMPDVLPQEFEEREHVRGQMQACFESYGYRGIQVPVVEPAELYQRKSGPDVLEKMYTFEDRGNREVCLRPELTASAARLCASLGRTLEMPARWHYCGAAFRYDRPQKGRFRQFTHMGVELFGDDSALADAEMVALACESLERAGVNSYELRLGHIEPVTEFLSERHLALRDRAELVAMMQEFSKRPTEEVLAEFMSEQSVPRSGALPPHRLLDERSILNALSMAGDGQISSLTTALLSSYRTDLYGTRTVDEISQRLAAKVADRGRLSEKAEAARFIAELSRIQGTPNEAISEMRSFTAEHELSAEPLHRLEETLQAMSALGVDESKVVVDFGFGRGLEYYTGAIFEINCSWLGDEKQICGGGRYDALVQMVGGEDPVAGCGFAFGLERVLIALREQPGAQFSVEEKRPQVLAAALDSASLEYAAGLARQLRATGLRTALILADETGFRSVFRRARRLGVPFIAAVGENERAAGTVSMRWLAANQPQTKVFRLCELPRVSELVRSGGE